MCVALRNAIDRVLFFKESKFVMQTLGKELRLWRRTIANMTQNEVALRLGMTRGGYANYEAGVKIPA